MNEEMNKQQEAEVKAEAPVETMEDYAAELEASYKAFDERHFELPETDDAEGEKWAEFAQMMADRTVLNVKIAEAVKGGVVAFVNEVRAFIPASQLSTEYVEKLEDWQGKHVDAVIITVDPEKKRLVLSGREVEKEKKAAQRKERLAQFKAGDVVEGTVDNIKDYGAFVKLADGIDGLLHISQISTQRIKHPGAVLKEGQTVKVKILSIADGKISLSMKALIEQETEEEEHETFDYKETAAATTGLGDLLKGLKQGAGMSVIPKTKDQVDQWRSVMFLYDSALKKLNTKIEILNNEFVNRYDHNPIEHIKSRLKTADSIVKKLKKDGYEVTIENMMDHLSDIAGIRIICSFTSDIYQIADMIAAQGDITVLHVKDYIQNPKPNGYKSYHMVVTVPVYLADGPVQTKVEIQIRSVAMDFWASLEHKIAYKFEGNAPEGLLRELKECADVVDMLDKKRFYFLHVINDKLFVTK